MTVRFDVPSDDVPEFESVSEWLASLGASDRIIELTKRESWVCRYAADLRLQAKCVPGTVQSCHFLDAIRSFCDGFESASVEASIEQSRTKDLIEWLTMLGSSADVVQLLQREPSIEQYVAALYDRKGHASKQALYDAISNYCQGFLQVPGSTSTSQVPCVVHDQANAREAREKQCAGAASAGLRGTVHTNDSFHSTTSCEAELFVVPEVTFGAETTETTGAPRRNSFSRGQTDSALEKLASSEHVPVEKSQSFDEKLRVKFASAPGAEQTARGSFFSQGSRKSLGLQNFNDGDASTVEERRRSYRRASSMNFRAFLPERFNIDVKDHYELEKNAFGEGGFGSVFLAKDAQSGRVVAIKKITDTAKRQDEVMNEAAIMKELDHPNICKLLETFMSGDRIFFVLEYCEGGELFDRIVKDGKISESLSADVISQVSSALRYAHGRGIAHRDMKPENICFWSAERSCTQIKIIDWGLSVLFDNKSMSTAVGSLSYAAPEQLCGFVDITIDHTDGGRLGLDLSYTNEGSLVVEHIKEGIVAKYNAENSGRELRQHDKIIMVNGVYGDSQKIVMALQELKELKMKVERARPTKDDRSYGCECDLWSLGVITYVMLCGKPPFWGPKKHMLTKMLAESYPFSGPIWSTISEQAKDFIRCLLIADPHMRTPIEQVSGHPWLRSWSTENEPDKAVTSEVLTNLRRSSKNSLFQTLCATAVARQLDHSSLQDIHRVFRDLDTNGDGVLSMEEIKQGFKKIFPDDLHGEQDIDEFFLAADLDGSGTIDYTEFCAAGIGFKATLAEDVLWATFRQFDSDGSGTIKASELADVLSSVMCQDTFTKEVCEKVAQDILDKYDADGNGSIDFQEWQSLMQTTLQSRELTRQLTEFSSATESYMMLEYSNKLDRTVTESI